MKNLFEGDSDTSYKTKGDNAKLLNPDRACFLIVTSNLPTVEAARKAIKQSQRSSGGCNLTEEEQSLLDESVVALRSQFVEITKLINQAQAEGRIGPDGTLRDPAGGGGAPGTPGGAPPDLGL